MPVWFPGTVTCVSYLFLFAHDNTLDGFPAWHELQTKLLAHGLFQAVGSRVPLYVEIEIALESRLINDRNFQEIFEGKNQLVDGLVAARNRAISGVKPVLAGS